MSNLRRRRIALGQVITRCRHCGFDVPVDADRCPWCAPAAEPPLAARQVAGLALRTRSVHALPAIAPRREHAPAPVGRADGARGAFGYTVLFLLVALLGLSLGWTARLDRFVLSLPDGTADRIEAVAQLAAWASVIGLAVGLAAMAQWGVRRLTVARAHRGPGH